MTTTIKHYYIKNVLKQITRKKAESFFIFVTIFLMTIFLSLIHFFVYDESIESNIANQLSLQFEIKNDHLLSKSSTSKRSLKEPKKVFNDFYHFFLEIGEDPRLSYADFNLNFNQNFGISNSQFLEKNHYTLIEGRNFTQQEIDNGEAVMIVSDKSYHADENGLQPIQLNDQVDIHFFDDYVVSCKVIGIYKSEIRHQYTYGNNDSFINSQGSLIPNQIIFEAVQHDPQFDFDRSSMSNLFFNHIVYQVADYSSYFSFKDTLNDQLKQFTQAYFENESMNINFELVQNNEENILQSLKSIKSVFQIVFMSLLGIVCLLFALMIAYFFNRKQKEIYTYITLGQSKQKIILHYLLAYLFIGIFAMLLAFIVGYFISTFLKQQLITNNFQTQMELLRFTSNSVSVTQLTELSYSYTLRSCITIFIEVFLFIVFTSVISLYAVMKRGQRRYLWRF